MMIRWDEWRGPPNASGFCTIEDAVMLVKHLASIRGWKVDLHCFIAGDALDCFHTHPAWAFRLILWGGYCEEMESEYFRKWWPGMFGFVAPWLSHRVAYPLRARSYSLWIRGPKKYPIQLRGTGWKR